MSRMRLGWLLVIGALVSACADRPTGAAKMLREARAELRNSQGEPVGSAVLREEDGRIRILVQARGLTPGRHGIHVHAIGRCEPPSFTSAGDHFNPLGKKHGLENPEGVHAGDLPNLEADASGRAQYTAVTNRLTLAAGPTSIFDNDGSAVVIHANADDQRTDPSGNSGDRVLCGEVAPGPAGAAAPRP